MKYVIFTLFVLITISCTSQKEKNFSELEKLASKTDSLLGRLQTTHNQISEHLYFISDDSLKRDSLIGILNLPDSMGFYQFIEKSQNELTELVFQTQQEVYFVEGQIGSVKTEYINNNISEKEYQNEVYNLIELIQFLEERIDSNLMLIRENYYFGDTKNDSLT